MERRVLLGGYSSEVPPLPIPNREVKLTHADGTAYLGGRVGSRLFKSGLAKDPTFFVVMHNRKRLFSRRMVGSCLSVGSFAMTHLKRRPAANHIDIPPKSPFGKT